MPILKNPALTAGGTRFWAPPECRIDADDPALKGYFGCETEDPAVLRARETERVRELMRREAVLPGRLVKRGVDAEDSGFLTFSKEEDETPSTRPSVPRKPRRKLPHK